MTQKGTENIEFLSNAELQERLERQEKLLANRRFLQRLPDKGQKILETAEKLRFLISERKKVEDTLEKFTKLTLTETVFKNVDNMNDEKSIEDDVPEMDEEVAHGTKTGVSEFKQKKKPLKKHLKLHVPKNPSSATKELSETWNYESAITHPKGQCEKAKMLSVEESTRLHHEQNKHIQELESETATLRLRDTFNSTSDESTMTGKVVTNPYKYRNKEEFDPLESEGSDAEDSENAEPRYEEYDDIE